MTDLAARSQSLAEHSAVGRVNPGRMAFGAVLVGLLFASPELRNITVSALADAYLQVSVFVAATLALAYVAEKAFKRDLGLLLERSGRWQVPLAALLGAVPGCGGAIIVVTHFARGHLSFGAVVAVLVSTMGDAAFLLIARDPAAAFVVIALCLASGVATGWAIDRLVSRGHLRPEAAAPRLTGLGAAAADERRPGGLGVGFRRLMSRLWLVLLGPGLVLGVFGALQMDTDAFFGPLSRHAPTQWVGAAGAMLCVGLWLTSRGTTSHAGAGGLASLDHPVWPRTIIDTNFVTAWVVAGFLAYELAVHFTGSGVEQLFDVWRPVVPFIAVVVGFLPGCGPQIVVTSLYLAGAVPLSAQIGNAISNDGDALFPAIALAPRAAIMATVYSALPGLILAYAWFVFVE